MKRYLEDQHGLEDCNKLWRFFPLKHPTLDNVKCQIKTSPTFERENQYVTSNTSTGLPLSELHIVPANRAAVIWSSCIKTQLYHIWKLDKAFRLITSLQQSRKMVHKLETLTDESHG